MCCLSVTSTIIVTRWSRSTSQCSHKAQKAREPSYFPNAGRNFWLFWNSLYYTALDISNGIESITCQLHLDRRGLSWLWNIPRRWPSKDTTLYIPREWRTPTYTHSPLLPMTCCCCSFTRGPWHTDQPPKWGSANCLTGQIWLRMFFMFFNSYVHKMWVLT